MLTSRAAAIRTSELRLAFTSSRSLMAFATAHALGAGSDLKAASQGPDLLRGAGPSYFQGMGSWSNTIWRTENVA